MSKSDPDQGSRIELVDPAEIIEKKIKKAVTDSSSLISYDPEKRPGVATLIDLESACTGLLPEEIAERCLFQSIEKLEYKRHVSNILIKHLEPIQKEYLRLINDKEGLRSILDEGANKANQIAAENFKQIAQLIGSRWTHF